MIYEMLIGNAPGLETFWHDLASKFLLRDPRLYSIMNILQRLWSISFVTSSLISRVSRVRTRTGASRCVFARWCWGGTTSIGEVRKGKRERFWWGRSSYRKRPVRLGIARFFCGWCEGHVGVTVRLHRGHRTLRNAIDMERARRQALENILLSGEDVHLRRTRMSVRVVCAVVVTTMTRTDRADLWWCEIGDWWILEFPARSDFWHVKNFVWSAVNGLFMCVSILISSSQLLTLVAHRDVLDSSSPRTCFVFDRFRRDGFIVTVLPFESFQNAISRGVRELLM